MAPGHKNATGDQIQLNGTRLPRRLRAARAQRGHSDSGAEASRNRTDVRREAALGGGQDAQHLQLRALGCEGAPRSVHLSPVRRGPPLRLAGLAGLMLRRLRRRRRLLLPLLRQARSSRRQTCATSHPLSRSESVRPIQPCRMAGSILPFPRLLCSTAEQ